MTQYQRGVAREREVMALMEDRGWDVPNRGAGSHGIDVPACRQGVIRYIEVKATKAGPFSGFGPADRAAFLRKARRAGAEAWLCWWPYDRQGPRWIPEAAWPGDRKD